MSDNKNYNLDNISSEGTTILISLILIAVLALFIYSNSVTGGFIWDDHSLVKDNVYIRNFSYLPNIFTKDITAGIREPSFSYRPLQMLTYMIDYSLWRLDTRGYHLTNILLHILVSWSIFWFIFVLFRNFKLSLFTAILFVVHPVHTEAVTYISGRAEPLCALFILLSLIFYIKFTENKKFVFYILFSISFILSLLSKESALILPLLLVIYHYILKRKINRSAFISAFIIAFIYAGLRLTVLYSGSYQAFSKVSFIQRLPGFFYAISYYIRLMILPVDLHMEYGMLLLPFNNPYVLLGIIMTALLLILAFLIRKTNRIASFSIFFFFIMLIPVSNIYPINATLAEHWLYLPSIGFFVILGWILTFLYRLKGFKIVTAIFLIGLVGIFSHLTIKQNKYWHNPISFYKRTLKYTPSSVRLYVNLSNAYWKKGEYKKSVKACKRAIKIDPNYFIAYNNLGNAYLNLGEYKKAKSCFKKAISLNPKHPSPYNNLGWAYFLGGDYDKALILYKRAIKLDVNYSDPYYNLAVLFYKQGKYDLAIEYCHKAEKLGHRIRPNFQEALEKIKSKK